MSLTTTEAVLALVSVAAMLGLIANGALFWAVKRLVSAVDALVTLMVEIHRKVMVTDDRLRGDVEEVKQKVEHLEAGAGNGD